MAGRLFVAEAGVALLDFTEETLFGGEEDSCSVGVDAAAFEDEAMVSNSGLELGHVVVFGDVLGNLVVAAPVVVFGPGVELPVSDGDLARGVFYKDGAGVAEPDPIGGPLVEVEAGEVGSGALEQAGGAALGGEVVDEDVDVFDSRTGGGRFRYRPREWAEIFRASLRRYGARRSRWRREEPTRRACGNFGRVVSSFWCWRPSLVSGELGWAGTSPSPESTQSIRYKWLRSGFLVWTSAGKPLSEG